MGEGGGRRLTFVGGEIGGLESEQRIEASAAYMEKSRGRRLTWGEGETSGLESGGEDTSKQLMCERVEADGLCGEKGQCRQHVWVRERGKRLRWGWGEADYLLLEGDRWTAWASRLRETERA